MGSSEIQSIELGEGWMSLQRQDFWRCSLNSYSSFDDFKQIEFCARHQRVRFIVDVGGRSLFVLDNGRLCLSAHDGDKYIGDEIRARCISGMNRKIAVATVERRIVLITLHESGAESADTLITNLPEVAHSILMFSEYNQEIFRVIVGCANATIVSFESSTGEMHTMLLGESGGPVSALLEVCNRRIIACVDAPLVSLKSSLTAEETHQVDISPLHYLHNILDGLSPSISSRAKARILLLDDKLHQVDSCSANEIHEVDTISFNASMNLVAIASDLRRGEIELFELKGSTIRYLSILSVSEVGGVIRGLSLARRDNRNTLTALLALPYDDEDVIFSSPWKLAKFTARVIEFSLEQQLSCDDSVPRNFLESQMFALLRSIEAQISSLQSKFDAFSGHVDARLDRIERNSTKERLSK